MKEEKVLKRRVSQSTIAKKVSKKRVTKKKKLTPLRAQSPLERYKFYSKYPITKVMADDLATELIEWVIDNDKATTFNSFLVQAGLSKMLFHRVAAKSEKLREAKKYAMMAIGDRRENGALNKKFDFNATKLMQGHYDPDWQAREEFLASLKKTSDSSNVTKEELFNIVSQMLKPVSTNNE